MSLAQNKTDLALLIEGQNIISLLTHKTTHLNSASGIVDSILVSAPNESN